MKKNSLTKENLLLALVVAIFVFELTTYLGHGLPNKLQNMIPQKKAAPEFLYVQEARSGSFTEQEDGTYELLLRNVSENTTYFVDRPYRESGKESTQAFVDLWGAGQDSFRNNPPNAAVSFQGTADSVVVELSDPAYDAEAKTLTYTAHAVGAGTFPKIMSDVSVFIDSGAYICIASVCVKAGTN